MHQLMWFRTDLRVHDNTALHHAMQTGPTIALFLISPGQWQAHDDAPCKVDFWLRNLTSLQAQLQALNVPLLIAHIDTWQEAPNAIAELCKVHRIDAVHLNDEYGINETRRDQACVKQLATLGVACHRYLDQLLIAPGRVLTQAGSVPKVFSQFRKQYIQRLRISTPACLPKPKAQKPLNIASSAIAEHVEGFPTPSAELRQYWPAGEDHAHARLNAFAEQHLEEYAAQRDLPAEPGTSQLSPYLAAGVLSPRQCLHGALRINHGELDSGNAGVRTWIDELLWREFYKHILVGYPQVSRHRAFRPHTEALPWRNAPEELAAWQQGKTGFVLIDAAIRQLLATGWMHNRLRMLVAMFLSKNLLIDWREGERFFMRHLIDGDLAANNGGWQWCASTGTDAVPYFRLFNPVTQAKRFDPKGRFIRHWLPELAQLSDRELHTAPVNSLFLKSSYPKPLVELSASRERVLQAFSNLTPTVSVDV